MTRAGFAGMAGARQPDRNRPMGVTLRKGAFAFHHFDRAKQRRETDMDMDDTTDTYHVVMNGEEQYSYLADMAARYRRAGALWARADPRQDCLNYIEKVWTDMRPLSLRKRMAEQAAAGPTPEVEVPEIPRGPEGHDSLVWFLATGQHPVELSLRPEKSASALAQAIERD